ncbi:MAG: L-lactate permease [Chloroflexi bacterium]|nr:L-lactate permease [Chloroflexota bacterium]
MTLLSWLLAASPVLVVLVLMVGWRQSALVAGSGGWLVAVVVAIVWFGAGTDLIVVAQGKALLMALDVLLIIWTALLLFRVTNEAGALNVLGEQLTRLTPDRVLQALLLGWMFITFLQGVGGFGVPVAVVAPLLLTIGFTPTAAILIATLGHAWGSTFGSLASAFQALIATSGLSGYALAPYAAAMLGLAGLAGGIGAAHVAGGWSGLRRNLGTILLVGAVMGGVQWGLASLGLWTIAAFSAGLAGVGIGVLLARRGAAHRGQERPATDGDNQKLALSLSAYAILIVLAITIQAIPPVKAALGHVVLRLNFPQVQTAMGYVTPAEPGRVISLLNHTGMVLALTSLLAFAVYAAAGWYKPGAGRRILTTTLRSLLEPTLGIIAMVGMAAIMSHAGLTDVLARGLATAVGRAFPLVSPFIGALGAFMTGSNTNSNVVFVMLQMRTANLLRLDVLVIIAAQTTGAALGSVISPAKVIVGCSSTGQSGREGLMMRAMLPYILAILALVAVVTLLAAR